MLRKLRIKLEKYKVIKFIGKGQFNEVFLVEEKATKKQYAAKVSIQICEDSNKQIQFIKEVEIFSKVDYPTVLHFIGFNPQNFELKPYPTVITDFIPNGSLETMLKQASLGQAPVKWSETSRYIVLLGSALGMNYLHKKGIIHRDIKPANILLNEDFYPVICDFGFSKFTSERFAEFLMSSQIGTPFYMAPEILRNAKYAFNVDVYSFSLVAFQLITCKIPPFGFDCKLIEGKENQEFFTKCYSLDPLQRPTFYDICFRITKKDFMMNFESVVIDDLLDFFDFLGNDADTLFFIGNFLFENDSANEAADYFKDSADRGNVDAMLKYADMLYEGVGVDIDKESACSYYYKAAEEGNAEAMYKYAKMLNDSDGVEQDKIESLLYFQKSSEKGYEKAKYVLFSDFGLKTDEKKGEEKKIENEENEEVKEVIKETKEEEEEDNTPKENDDDDSHIWDTDDSEEKEEDAIKAAKTDDQISNGVSDEIYYEESKEELDPNQELKTFIDANYLEYKIFMKSGTASITGVPKDKEEIDVPLFVRCQGQKFDVTAVDERAFSGSKLKALLFSEDSKLETIKDFAFAGSSIEELFIPSGVTALSANWCSGADKLTKIQVGPGNRFFSIRDGLLISKKLVNDGQEKRKSREILFAPRDIGGDFSIPAGITRIGNCSFGKREGLVSVASDTPSLQTIDSRAFSGCQNLERLKVCRASDLALCESCFSDSAKLSSVEIESEELNIGEESFSNCKSLQHVSLTKVRKIVLNPNAFSGCGKLSVFTINDQDSEHPNQGSFRICAAESVMIFGGCFNSCALLTSITISDVKEVTLLQSVFQGCDNLESLTINKSANIKIAKKCFAGSRNLKSLSFTGDSVTLSNSFIKDCPVLSHLYVSSKSDFKLLSGRLKGCKSLKIVNIHASSTLELCTNCFKETSIELAEFDGSLFGISDECLAGCSSLKTVSFNSEHDIKITSKMFQECLALETLIVTSGSSLYIEKEFMNNSPKLNDVNIKGKKVIFGDDCFNNCSRLSTFTISCFAQAQIGKRLFKNSHNISKITIEMTTGEDLNAPRFTLNSSFFSETKNLKNIIFIGGQIILSENKNLSSIESFEIKKAASVTIDDSMFYNFKSLKEVSVESKTEVNFGKTCFQGCDKLEKVSISGANITFGEGCFQSCTSLESLTCSNAVTIIAQNRAFFTCSKLSTLDICASSDVTFGQSCFSRSGIQDVTIQGEKISIKDDCFKSTPIKKFSIPSANQIALLKSSFEKCEQLHDVKLGAANKLTIGDYCFRDAYLLANVEMIGEEVTTGKYSFADCKSIASLSLPNSSKVTFSKSSFCGCESINNIAVISRQEFTAGEYCFSRAKKLSYFIVESSKVSLGDLCFNQCSSLSFVSFPTASEITRCTNSFRGLRNIHYDFNPNAKIIYKKSNE
ncbi:hypothetical protein M9Y10_020356 [Tritrichomonas musculus]|uniref:Protein kinase domain-containing protein n=1 Tax=Tritrichomonas musculus TaxID=1915356 RepID=A0ABR2HG21_9EUKA